MHYAYCLSSESRLLQQKAQTIFSSMLWGCRIPANPDKSRPCLMHRRLRPIHTDCHLKLPTFQSNSEQSKRLLLFHDVAPPPFAQGIMAMFDGKITKKSRYSKRISGKFWCANVKLWIISTCDSLWQYAQSYLYLSMCESSRESSCHLHICPSWCTIA